MRLACALLIALTVACGPQPTGPAATETSPPARPEATAAGAASPVRSSGGPSPAPPATLAGWQTSALGPLRGDWVFVVRETFVPAAGVRVDIVALPLDGSGGTGQPERVAASYVKSAGGVILPPPEVLPRQFSSDGRRLALSMPAGVVVVALETGAATLVAPGCRSPVWGAGEHIAFHCIDASAALSTPPTGWIVPASGGTPREHNCGSALAWTFDGSSCIRPAAGGIVLDSPTQPTVTPFGWSVAFDSPPSYEVPISVRPAPGVTVLAIASTDLPRGGAGQSRTDGPYQHQIEVLSTPGAGQQTVVASESGRFTEVRFAAPRWNPRSDQILYRIEGSRRMETHIVDVQTKQDHIARISGVARAAEWTPNGEQIVYLAHRNTPVGHGTEVRAVRPMSGRDDRVLMRVDGTAQATFTSIAARGYPD